MGTRSTDEEQVISHRDLYFNSDTGHGTLEFRKSATSRTDFQEVSHSEHLYYESIHSENLYDESCAFRLQNLSGRCNLYVFLSMLLLPHQTYYLSTQMYGAAVF
jgi:hypothetical protein